MKASQAMIARYSHLAEANGGTVGNGKIETEDGKPVSSFVKDGMNWSVTWYGVVPGKPRQTQRDKWAKRPAVVRYRDFCDSLRAACGLVGKLRQAPRELNLYAFLPMPQSWSKKKKAAHSGEAHRTKPDIDNIQKSVMDALFADDSGIHLAVVGKYWEDSHGPRVILEVKW